jgi:hydroxymethylbilane synthase
MPSLHLRLGTRGSLLAQWQAQWVAARLEELGIAVELVPVTTSGDQQQMSGEPISGTGIFTKELQRELPSRRIDLAVHSLKDLPTDAVPGLCLAAVPARAVVGDVLVSTRYASLDDLPRGAVVGTGSLRRRAQLLHVRSDLQMRDIRGNVDTRLKKLRRGEYDAIVLAEAGLTRLGLADQITQRLPLDLLLPAVGQGALGIESREDEPRIGEALAPLEDAATRAAVTAERAMLATLRGGCMAPVAAWARMEDEVLTLTGRVLSVDGTGKLEHIHTAPPQQSAALGRHVAEALLADGAAAMIEAARRPDKIGE